MFKSIKVGTMEYNMNIFLQTLSIADTLTEFNIFINTHILWLPIEMSS